MFAVNCLIVWSKTVIANKANIPFLYVSVLFLMIKPTQSFCLRGLSLTYEFKFFRREFYFENLLIFVILIKFSPRAKQLVVTISEAFSLLFTLTLNILTFLGVLFNINIVQVFYAT